MLLIGAIVIGRGFTLALFDPRLLLPALIMLTPAVYVWREGIDVLPEGIVRRVHVPRYYHFDELKTWTFERRDGQRLIIIWDDDERKLVEVSAVLTDLPTLLATLRARVRGRSLPPNL